MIIIIKFLIVSILLIAIWINVDNFRIKIKVTQLTDKVERLSKSVHIKSNLPKDELPDEVKINYLKNQLDSLELLILNRSCQDKDRENKQQ